MKIRNTLRTALRCAVAVLFVLPTAGCPRKKIVFHLSPDSMQFTADVSDGGPPPDQILTMTGIDDIPQSGLTWSAQSDQPWLSLQPSSGILHASEPILLTIHADQSVLPSALYTGEITIVARFGRNRYPQTYTVTFDVTNNGEGKPGR